MSNKDLFIKTAFAVMACDGDIAPEELDLLYHNDTLKSLCSPDELRLQLSTYLQEIQSKGADFLSDYLRELKLHNFSQEDALKIALLTLDIIEADGILQYTEIKMFKRIRSRLAIDDELILQHAKPEILGSATEDFLLPDLIEDPLEWSGLTIPKDLSIIN